MWSAVLDSLHPWNNYQVNNRKKFLMLVANFYKLSVNVIFFYSFGLCYGLFYIDA